MDETTKIGTEGLFCFVFKLNFFNVYTSAACFLLINAFVILVSELSCSRLHYLSLNRLLLLKLLRLGEDHLHEN